MNLRVSDDSVCVLTTTDDKVVTRVDRLTVSVKLRRLSHPSTASLPSPGISSPFCFFLSGPKNLSNVRNSRFLVDPGEKRVLVRAYYEERKMKL